MNMPEAHHSTIMFLVGFVALLCLIIAGTVVLSVFKKKKLKQIQTTEKLSQGSSEAKAESLKSEKQPVAIQSSSAARKAEVLESLPADYQISLTKTRSSIWGKIQNLFSSGNANPILDEIEEILMTADIGPQTVLAVVEHMKATLKKEDLQDLDKIKTFLKSEFQKMLSQVIPENYATQSKLSDRIEINHAPTVILVVGVNGAGKTTSIGKMAAQFAHEGKKVLVAAGDTFRAAAGSQLAIWTERAQVEIFSPENVSDPSAVAFDAIQKAKGSQYDVVIVDTAGRLHTQTHLMEELKKVKRVMAKVIADAPHETLLVLDANQGQNALMQAKEYNQALDISGVILTKMDGTAKGGVAIGLANELKRPIKLIGLGEKIQDLELFQKEKFIEALF